MGHRAFEPTQIERGGQRVRGYRVICGGCSMTEKVPLATVKGFSLNEEKEYRLAARKFVAAGWFVGGRERDDRCPKCIQIKKLAHAAEREKERMRTMAMNGAAPTMTHTQVASNTSGSTVSTMTREQRQIIFAKLQDVYVGEKVGYAAGWTDAKVAADLGIPRAWVTEVRDQFFGPLMGNEDIAAAVAEGKQVIADAKAAIAAMVTKVTAEIAPLRDKLDRIERKVFDLAKTLT